MAVSTATAHGGPWRADGPHFLGHIIHHLVLDPRDGRTLLAAAKTGHLGPTVFRSTDLGRTWKEAAAAAGLRRRPRTARRGAVVDHTFWLTPAHANEPDVWYAGTSPQGLFRSEDGGVSWEPSRASTTIRSTASGWAACRTERPTGRRCTRSSSTRAIPRISISAMSGGGVHESLDGGRTWKPLIDGLEVVEGFDPQHDPRSTTRIACGSARAIPTGSTSRTTAASTGSTARRTSGCASARTMPKEVGDVGFPMVVHPRDDDTAWVFPMDGTDRVAAHQPSTAGRRRT